MTTGQTSTAEKEFRRGVGFTRTLPRNLITAVFACSSCNWPLITSTFTEQGVQDDLHDSVFELSCEHCGWKGAVLGRDAVDSMVNDWTSHKIHDHSRDTADRHERRPGQ